MLEKLGLGATLEFFTGGAIAAMTAADGARDKLHSGFERLGRGVDQVSGGMKQALGGVATIGAAAAAAGAGAVQRFAAFESELGKISTLLDDGMDGALKMGPAIEDMSVKFGKGATELADAQFQAVSAGVAANEASDFMAEASKGAVAGFTKPVTAVDALTTAINAYGDSLFVQGTAAEKAAALNDAMFVANKVGKTTYDELAASLGLVAPTAAQAGVDFREVTSAIAAMTLVGVNTRMSVTSLNQALLSFINPTAEAKTAAAKLGFEMNGALLKTMGFAGAIKFITEKVGDDQEAMTNLFGSVEAYRAIAPLAGKSAETFASTLATTKATVGITDTAFQNVSQTLEFQFARSLQAADRGARLVGGTIVEHLGLRGVDATERIGKAFEWVSDKVGKFIDSAKRGFEILRIEERANAIVAKFGQIRDAIAGAFGTEAGQRAADIAAALSVMATAAVPVAMVLAPLVSIFTGLATVGMGVVTMMGGMAGVSAGLSTAVTALGAAFWPVTAIVVLVGALFDGLARNASGLRDAFGDLLGSVGNVTGALMSAVGSIVDGLMPAFQAISNVLAAVLAPVLRLTATLFDALAPILSSLGELLGGVFGVVGELAGILADILVPILQTLGTVLEWTLVPVFKSVGLIIGAIVDAITWLVEKVRDAIHWFRELFNEANNTLPDVAAQAADVQRAQGKDVATRGGWMSDMIAGPGGADQGPLAPSLPTRAANRVASASSSVQGANAANAQAVGKAAAKTKIDINNRLSVNGRDLHVANSRASLELTERAGAGVTPWQRRQIVERGAVPTGAP